MGADRYIIDAHVRDLERRNLRPSTIYQRRRVLARMAAQHPGRGLLTLTGDEIATALDARNITAGTRATEISHLAKFYDWASWQHGIDNPMLHIIRPKLPRRLPRPMPDADVQRALEMAEGRTYRALMLATYAGLRACEIANCRYEDAQLDGEPVLFVPVGKGGGMSSVPMHLELVAMWRTCPKVGWVFPRADDLAGPSKPWLVSQLANRFLHSQDIAHTLHSLRHWFGTKVYGASRDLRATQEVMRHLSPVTTAGYTYMAPSELHSAVAGVPVATGERKLRVVT